MMFLMTPKGSSTHIFSVVFDCVGDFFARELWLHELLTNSILSSFPLDRYVTPMLLNRSRAERIMVEFGRPVPLWEDLRAVAPG